MAKSKTYTLSVGEEDKHRLSGLNYFCNPFTWQALEHADINLCGKVVADIGCGSGVVAIELAKRVGALGKVIAVDISEEQLIVAKNLATEHSVSNIEFICCDVHDLSQLNLRVDMVYTRFVIEHVHQQKQVVAQMVDMLKDGGLIFCETATSYEAVFCEPPSVAFTRWREVILSQPKVFDTNFFVGKKLYHYFSELGLQTIYTCLQQPTMLNCQQRTDFFAGLQNPGTHEPYVEKGFFSKNEINKIADDIVDLVRDQDSIIGFVQYLQIIGRKQS